MWNPFRSPRTANAKIGTTPTDRYPARLPTPNTQRTKLYRETPTQTTKADFPDRTSTVETSTLIDLENPTPSGQRISTASLPESAISTLQLGVQAQVSNIGTASSINQELDRRLSDQQGSTLRVKDAEVNTSPINTPSPNATKSNWPTIFGDWFGAKSSNRLSTSIDPPTKEDIIVNQGPTFSNTAIPETVPPSKINRGTSNCAEDLRKILAESTKNTLNIDEPVLVTPADKPGIVYIPGITNLPLTSYPHSAFCCSPPPFCSLPLPSFTFPLSKPIAGHALPICFLPVPGGTAGFPNEDPPTKPRKRRHSVPRCFICHPTEHAEAEDAESCDILCHEPYNWTETNCRVSECHVNSNATEEHSLDSQGEMAEQKECMDTTDKPLDHRNTCPCRLEADNLQQPQAVPMVCLKHAPSAGYVLCPYCCMPTCVTAVSSRCQTQRGNVCDNQGLENNVTHVNATVVSSVQVSLRNSNSKKKPKVKKYNFNLETIKTLSSLFAGKLSPSVNNKRSNCCHTSTECCPSGKKLLMNHICSTAAQHATCHCRPSPCIQHKDPIPSTLKCSFFGRHIKQLLRKFDQDLSKLPYRRTRRCYMNENTRNTANSSCCAVKSPQCNSLNEDVPCNSAPVTCKKRNATITCCDDDVIICRDSCKVEGGCQQKPAPMTCGKSSVTFTCCDDDIFTGWDCSGVRDSCQRPDRRRPDRQRLDRCGYCAFGKKRVRKCRSRPGHCCYYESQAECCWHDCFKTKADPCMKNIPPPVDVDSVCRQSDSSAETENQLTSSDIYSESSAQPIPRPCPCPQMHEEAQSSTTADVLSMQEEAPRKDTKYRDKNVPTAAYTDASDENSNIDTMEQQQQQATFNVKDYREVSEAEMYNSDSQSLPGVKDDACVNRCRLNNKRPCRDNNGQSRNTHSRNDCCQVKQEDAFKCHMTSNRHPMTCTECVMPRKGEQKNMHTFSEGRSFTQEHFHSPCQEDVSSSTEEVKKYITQNKSTPDNKCKCRTAERQAGRQSPSSFIHYKNHSMTCRQFNDCKFMECLNENADICDGKHGPYLQKTDSRQLGIHDRHDHPKQSIFCAVKNKSTKSKGVNFLQEPNCGNGDRKYDSHINEIFSSSQPLSMETADGSKSSEVDKTETNDNEEHSHQENTSFTVSQRNSSERQINTYNYPECRMTREDSGHTLEPSWINDRDSNNTENVTGVVYAMSNSRYNDTAHGHMLGGTFSCTDDSQEQSTIYNLPELDSDTADGQGQQNLLKDVSRLLNMQVTTNNGSGVPNQPARDVCDLEDIEQEIHHDDNTFTCTKKCRHKEVYFSKVLGIAEDKNTNPSSIAGIGRTREACDFTVHLGNKPTPENKHRQECKIKKASNCVIEEQSQKTFTDSKNNTYPLSVPNIETCHNSLTEAVDVLKLHELHTYKGYISNRKQSHFKHEPKRKMSIFCALKRKYAKSKDGDTLHTTESRWRKGRFDNEKGSPAKSPCTVHKSMPSSVNRIVDTEVYNVDNSSPEHITENKHEYGTSEDRVRLECSEKYAKPHLGSDEELNKVKDSVGIVYAMANSKHKDMVDSPLFGRASSRQGSSREHCTISSVPGLDLELSLGRGQRDVTKDVSERFHIRDRTYENSCPPIQSDTGASSREEQDLQIPPKGTRKRKKKSKHGRIKSKIRGLTHSSTHKHTTPAMTCRDFISKGDYAKHAQGESKQTKKNAPSEPEVHESTQRSMITEQYQNDLIGKRDQVNPLAIEHGETCPEFLTKDADILKLHELHTYAGYISNRKRSNLKREQNRGKVSIFCAIKKKYATFKHADRLAEFESKHCSEKEDNEEQIALKCYGTDCKSVCSSAHKAPGARPPDMGKTESEHINKETVKTRAHSTDTGHESLPTYQARPEKSDREERPCWFRGGDSCQSVGVIYAMSNNTHPYNLRDSLSTNTLSYTDNSQEQSTACNLPELDSELSVGRGQHDLINDLSELLQKTTNIDMSPQTISCSESSQGEDSCSQASVTSSQNSDLQGNNRLKLQQNRASDWPVYSCTEVGRHLLVPQRCSREFFDNDSGPCLSPQNTPQPCAKEFGHDKCRCLSPQNVSRPCSRQFGHNRGHLPSQQNIKVERICNHLATAGQYLICQCCSVENDRCHYHFTVKSICNSQTNSQANSHVKSKKNSQNKRVLKPKATKKLLSMDTLEEFGFPHTHHSMQYRLNGDNEDSVCAEFPRQHGLPVPGNCNGQKDNKFMYPLIASEQEMCEKKKGKDGKVRTKGEIFSVEERFTNSIGAKDCQGSGTCSERSCRCNYCRCKNSPEKFHATENKNVTGSFREDRSGITRNDKELDIQNVNDHLGENNKQVHRNARGTITNRSSADNRQCNTSVGNGIDIRQRRLNNDDSSGSGLSYQQTRPIFSDGREHSYRCSSNTDKINKHGEYRGPSKIDIGPEHEKHGDFRHAEITPTHQKHGDLRHAETTAEHDKHGDLSYADITPKHEKHRDLSHAQFAPKLEKHRDLSYAETTSETYASHQHQKHSGESKTDISHTHQKHSDESKTDISHTHHKHSDESKTDISHTHHKHSDESKTDISHTHHKHSDESKTDFSHTHNHIDKSKINHKHQKISDGCKTVNSHKHQKHSDESEKENSHKHQKHSDESKTDDNHKHQKHSDENCVDINYECRTDKEPSYGDINDRHRTDKEPSYGDINDRHRTDKEPSYGDINDRHRTDKEPSYGDLEPSYTHTNCEHIKHAELRNIDSNYEHKKLTDSSLVDSHCEHWKPTDKSHVDSHCEHRTLTDPSYVDVSHSYQADSKRRNCCHVQSSSDDGYILSQSVSLSDAGSQCREAHGSIQCNIEQNVCSVKAEAYVFPFSSNNFYKTSRIQDSRSSKEGGSRFRSCCHCGCRSNKRKLLTMPPTEDAYMIYENSKVTERAYSCETHEGPCYNCIQVVEEVKKTTSTVHPCSKVKHVSADAYQTRSQSLSHESKVFPSQVISTSAPQRRKHTSCTVYPCHRHPSETRAHILSSESSELQVPSNFVRQNKVSQCSLISNSPESFGKSLGSTDARDTDIKCQNPESFVPPCPRCDSASYQHDSYTRGNTKQRASTTCSRPQASWGCPGHVNSVDNTSRESSQTSQRSSSSGTDCLSKKLYSPTPCHSCGQKYRCSWKTAQLY